MLPKKLLNYTQLLFIDYKIIQKYHINKYLIQKNSLFILKIKMPNKRIICRILSFLRLRIKYIIQKKNKITIILIFVKPIFCNFLTKI